jgi:DNA-binding SARP family transcriptional activator/TolB-like protein/tetratricopeptide (TPR) repeat protein
MVFARFLGGVSVDWPNGAMTERAAQRHPIALLSMLAEVQPGVVSRDKLLAHLWPEKDTASARNLLNQAVHALRQALGAEAVISRGNDLALNEAIVVTDVSRFETALTSGDHSGAVELYTGDFLDGFFLRGSPEFERWAEGERARLRRAYLKALEDLAQGAIATGNLVKAADWWRKLASRDPYNSRVTIRFMETLEVAGDRAGAILHGETFLKRLEEDLGVEQSPDVMTLVERMRHEPGAVRIQGSPGARAAPVASAHTFATPAAEESRGVPRHISERWPRSRAVIGILFSVAVLIAAGWVATGIGRDRSDTGPVALSHEMSGPKIAVLPFRNLTGDSSYGQLAEGLNELLNTQLYEVAGISSIASSSVREYENTNKSVAEIARELGVATVLEGSLRSDGEHAFFNAWLVDAATGTQLWADLYECELTAASLFSIQVDVAKQIAAALRTEIAGTDVQRSETPPTDNTQAYEYYVRAQALLGAPVAGPYARSEAEWMLRQAVRLDSTFALAWAGLAEYHSGAVSGVPALALAISRPATTPGAGRLTADSALRMAVAFGPGLPETIRAQGWYHFNVERDRAAALASFDAALGAPPTDPDLTGAVGLIHISQGEWDQGVQYLKRALRLDPRSSWRAALLGQTYAHLRSYQDAERFYDRALAVAPTYAEGYIGKAILHLKRNGDVARARRVLEDASNKVDRGELVFAFTQPVGRDPFVRILDDFFRTELADSSVSRYIENRCGFCYWHLAAVLAERSGDLPTARAYNDSLFTHLTLRPERSPVRLTAVAAAVLGRHQEAARYAAELVGKTPLSSEAVTGYHVLLAVAEVQVRIGDLGSAVSALEQLLSHPGLLSVPVLELDPLWEPLREDREFQRLLREYR